MIDRLPRVTDPVVEIFDFKNKEVAQDSRERSWFATVIEMRRTSARLPYPANESDHRFELEVKAALDCYNTLIERFDIASKTYQQWSNISYEMYVHLFRRIVLPVNARTTTLLVFVQLTIAPAGFVRISNNLAAITPRCVKDHVLHALHQAGGVNRCVRGYADGSFSSVLELNEEETKQWAEHNKVYRFGCSQFINGKCTYRGPHANDKWVKKMERRLVNDSSR